MKLIFNRMTKNITEDDILNITYTKLGNANYKRIEVVLNETLYIASDLQIILTCIDCQNYTSGECYHDYTSVDPYSKICADYDPKNI